MKEKRVLLDENAIMRAIRRISHEIVEQNSDLHEAILVGIERRGVYLASRLARQIESIDGVHVQTETINIEAYRDDRVYVSKDLQNGKQTFPIDTTGKLIILVDDVLYTGRTIRSALNALMEAGRPRAIRLAVLIDRGHRELPIRADFVGKNVPTARGEEIQVLLTELDGEDRVVILSP